MSNLYNLTQQKTDLELWKKDQSQALPASLENVLIEDCLEELKNETTRNRFNSLIPAQNANARVSKHSNQIEFGYMDSWTSHNWGQLTPVYKFFNLQLFLSRTPDGQAIMPFLDVKIKYKVEMPFDPGWPETLDHLLYREFTEALRTGNTFEEALEIINLIYLQNV